MTDGKVHHDRKASARRREGGSRTCNSQAPLAGGPFALAMMVAAFGYCVSDVAADGLTVQLAKKEGREAGADAHVLFI